MRILGGFSLKQGFNKECWANLKYASHRERIAHYLREQRPVSGAMPLISEPYTPGAVSTVGGLGTTQKIFQSTQPSGRYGVAVQDFLLAIPGSNRLNGKRIKINMSGNAFLHGTTPTLQLQLLGSVLGVANTILCQTAAVTLTTNLNYDWGLQAELLCSNLPTPNTTFPGGAGIVTGKFNSLIGGTVGADATLTNNLAGVAMGPGTPLVPIDPAFYCKAAVLFSVTDALALASLTEFYAYTEE